MPEPLYYGRITEQQFRDGHRYAEILCQEFGRTVPPWVDHGALISAAFDGVLRAARNYDARAGAWTTLLDLAVTHALIRCLSAERNWQRGRQPAARMTSAEAAAIQPRSLDVKIMDGDHHLADYVTDGHDLAAACCESLALEAVLAEIHPAQRELLRRRAEGWEIRELGEAAGVSRQAMYGRELQATKAARQAAVRLGTEEWIHD